ncbi:MAG: hypothetical protein KME21_02170 [Desmonostoc vinosum HA7617-LM4]|nr:hypothetical protein [Desmonostoc vinosum HA7617-LM4]
MVLVISPRLLSVSRMESKLHIASLTKEAEVLVTERICIKRSRIDILTALKGQ